MGDLSPVTVIELVAAVLAIPVTWLLARRGRQRPDLRYALDFDVLVSVADGIPKAGLRIAASEREISRISRTRIAFWNARGDTVRGSDVVGSDPVRLCFPTGDSPLSVRVLTSSRRQVALTATALPDVGDESAVSVEFDFLDAKDGGVVEILHEGLEPPRLVGTVRGARVRRLNRFGGVRLTNGALRAVAQRGPLMRLFRPFAISGSFLVVLALWTGYMFYDYFPRLLRGPRLVDMTGYGMNTVSGQADFARKVGTVGEITGGRLAAAAFLLVMLGLWIFLARSIMVPAIPSRIVRAEDIPAVEQRPRARRWWRSARASEPEAEVV